MHLMPRPPVSYDVAETLTTWTMQRPQLDSPDFVQHRRLPRKGLLGALRRQRRRRPCLESYGDDVRNRAIAKAAGGFRRAHERL